MPTLDDLKQILTSQLGFKPHHINDGSEQPAIILNASKGQGVKPEVEGIEECAQFLVATDVGNCYAAFLHLASTLSDAEANRYKALAILMPGGPAAYCVVQVGDVLRIFLGETGNELHELPEKYDSIQEAEGMVQELNKNPELMERLKQWAEKTLRTENSLSRFVQILEGCWQDIWDIENQRNDWIFDEFSRFLFIKMNEDSKPNGQFTTASWKSHCSANQHRGDKAAQDFINLLFDDLKNRFNGEKDSSKDENDLLFKSSERIESSAKTIEKVIKRLEKINLKDTEGDVLGRAFEKMLSDTL